jgi:hypothetical protein
MPNRLVGGVAFSTVSRRRSDFVRGVTSEAPAGSFGVHIESEAAHGPATSLLGRRKAVP